MLHCGSGKETPKAGVIVPVFALTVRFRKAAWPLAGVSMHPCARGTSISEPISRSNPTPLPMVMEVALPLTVSVDVSTQVQWPSVVQLLAVRSATIVSLGFTCMLALWTELLLGHRYQLFTYQMFG